MLDRDWTKDARSKKMGEPTDSTSRQTNQGLSGLLSSVRAKADASPTSEKEGEEFEEIYRAGAT